MFQITVGAVAVAFFTLVGYSVWEMYDHEGYAKAWAQETFPIRAFMAVMVTSISIAMGSFLMGLWSVV